MTADREHHDPRAGRGSHRSCCFSPGFRASRLLLDRERLVVAQRPHWIRLMVPLGRTLLGLLVALGAIRTMPGAERAPPAWLVPVVAAAAAVSAACVLLCWAAEYLAVTDRRLLSMRGLASQELSALRLDHVTSVEMESTPLGRPLGYGCVVVYHSGRHTGTKRFAQVCDPHLLSAILASRIAA